jgi:hypothetical protein
VKLQIPSMLTWSKWDDQIKKPKNFVQVSQFCGQFWFPPSMTCSIGLKDLTLIILFGWVISSLVV